MSSSTIFNIVDNNQSPDTGRLIVGRDYVVRIWPGFSSNLISQLDENISVGFISNPTVSHSEASLTVPNTVNYPSIAWSKANPKSQIFPLAPKGVAPYGITARDFLKDYVKQGVDNVNLRGSISYFGANSFSLYIDCLGVKENNITNNNFSVVKPGESQIKDFKMIFFVLYRSGTQFSSDLAKDPKNTKEPVEDYLRKNYNFFMDVYPFNKASVTKFDPSKIIYKKVSYDAALMDRGEDRKYLESLPRDEANKKIRYRIEQAGKIMGEIEAERLRQKADVAVIMNMDQEFMPRHDYAGYSNYYNPNSPGDGREKTSYVVILFDDAKSGPNVLAHEMGHNIADLAEEYSNTGLNSPLLYNKILGLAYSESGWKLNSSVSRPKINIWFEPNEDYLPKKGHTREEDLPETKATSSADESYLYVGPRYYNIMGNTGDSLDGAILSKWISADSYNKIIKKLETKGFLSDGGYTSHLS